MSKGRITIPTDENYVEGTKKIANLWGQMQCAIATEQVCQKTP